MKTVDVTYEVLEVTSSGNGHTPDLRKWFTVTIRELSLELNLSRQTLERRIIWINRAIPWFNLGFHDNGRVRWVFDHFQYWTITKVIRTYYALPGHTPSHKAVAHLVKQSLNEYTTEAYNHETERTSTVVGSNTSSTGFSTQALPPSRPTI